MARHKRNRRKQQQSFSLILAKLPVALLFFLASIGVFLYQYNSTSRVRRYPRQTRSAPRGLSSPYVPPAFRYRHIAHGEKDETSATHGAGDGRSTGRKLDRSSSSVVSFLNSASSVSEAGYTSTATRRSIPLAEIPSGPYPFPSLSVHKAQGNVHAIQPGSSWSAALVHGLFSSFPVHWLSELTHRASPDSAIAAQSTATVDAAGGASSIFRARRKADWIGCRRPHHLVCKGVYRAIKMTNSLSVAALNCPHHTGWLPHILRKLRDELRPVRLTCIVTKADKEADAAIRQHYGAHGLYGIVAMDARADNFPNGTDMLMAYRAARSGTLIDAMQLFRNAKRSGNVDMLVVDSFPDVDNMQARNGTAELRVNTGAAPFWFPAPEYEYSNEEENAEEIEMEIVAVRVSELFQESETPQMSDLIDPRKRVVQE